MIFGHDLVAFRVQPVSALCKLGLAVLVLMIVFLLQSFYFFDVLLFLVSNDAVQSFCFFIEFFNFDIQATYFIIQLQEFLVLLQYLRLTPCRFLSLAKLLSQSGYLVHLLLDLAILVTDRLLQLLLILEMLINRIIQSLAFPLERSNSILQILIVLSHLSLLILQLPYRALQLLNLLYVVRVRGLQLPQLCKYTIVI